MMTQTSKLLENGADANLRLVILLNNKVLIAPRLNSPIGRQCELSAITSTEEALALGEALGAKPLGAKPLDQPAWQSSTDYQNILGLWEVVSVEGKGGKLMSLDGNSKPGDLLTIPHVRMPSPENSEAGKAYEESPFVTRWSSEQAKRHWWRNDSMHLYLDTSPKRLTYKPIQGDQGHFQNPNIPPQFAIYHLDGDMLTIVAGDPRDFILKEGAETVTTSIRTSADRNRKIMTPNFPRDFEKIDEDRQLLVKLRKNIEGAQKGHRVSEEIATILNVIQQAAKDAQAHNYQQLVDALADEQVEEIAGLCIYWMSFLEVARQFEATTDEGQTQEIDALLDDFEELVETHKRDKPKGAVAAWKELSPTLFSVFSDDQRLNRLERRPKKFRRLLRQSSGILANSRLFVVEMALLFKGKFLEENDSWIDSLPNNVDQWKVTIEDDLATVSIPHNMPEVSHSEKIDLRRIGGNWKISNLHMMQSNEPRSGIDKPGSNK